MSYDVAIVGASLAGSAAAIHFGRAGLKVALIDRVRSMTAYKALCGHYVLGGTRPALERLEAWDAMVGQGAATSRLSIWTDGGWIVPPPDVPEAISMRRERLDPLIREMAASTPGVDLMLGHFAVDLLENGRRVSGVVARYAGGSRTIDARLVVGADGHRSVIADMAGVKAKIAANARFLYWGYYSGVHLRSPGTAALWQIDGNAAVAVPTDDDLVVLGAFPTKELLPKFGDDRLRAIERFFADLPDGPDMTRAVRESKAVGTSDYPMVRRPPTPRPGLALIGDAAVTSDPVPAVGCGWAFRSADWLAEATIPALLEGRSLHPGLRAYKRRHRFIDRHDRLIRSDARANGPNALQRTLRAAARDDPKTASKLARFSMRAIPVSGLLNPVTIARAVVTAHLPRSG